MPSRGKGSSATVGAVRDEKAKRGDKESIVVEILIYLVKKTFLIALGQKARQNSAGVPKLLAFFRVAGTTFGRQIGNNFQH